MFKDIEIKILADKSITKKQLKNVLEQIYTRKNKNNIEHLV